MEHIMNVISVLDEKEAKRLMFQSLYIYIYIYMQYGNILTWKRNPV